MKNKNKIIASRRKADRRQRIARYKQSLTEFLRRTKSRVAGNPDKSGYNLSGADSTLLTLTIGLLLFGWVMIYSGSFFIASQRSNTLITPFNPYHFFLLQGIWIAFGSLCAFVVYKIKYTAFKWLGIPYILSVVALLIVVILLPKELNGAKSWILIGGFSLQPSELAKPALIIYLASLFAKQNTTERFVWKKYLLESFLPFSIVSVGLAGLVILGGDLGSAAILLGIAIMMFFISDTRWQHNLSVGAVAVFGGIMGVIFVLLEPFRITRVKNYVEFLVDGQFRDQLNTGYQLYQTILAVGSGGIFGYGFGQSRQKYNYLQETAFNDTIFAVIAEEFGLLGSVLLIISFALLFFRGIKIAQQCPDRFSAFLAIGVVSWLFIQTIVHLGVNVGLIPLTGLTLPFISYGGSSLLACMIGIGLLLNVSKLAKTSRE